MSRIIKSLKQAVRYARGDEKAGTSALVLELPKPSVDRLRQMAIDTEVESIKEVVKDALQLYEGLIGELKVGSRLIVRHADGTEIVAMGGDES